MMYMSDIIDNAVYDGDSKLFQNMCGNTLDWFYFIGRTKEERQMCVDKEPTMFDDNHDRFRYAAYTQAGTHMLCDVYNLKTPSWVLDTRYKCKEPFFAGDVKGKLKLVYISESPVWFKMRNIYVPKNVFTRV